MNMVAPTLAPVLTCIPARGARPKTGGQQWQNTEASSGCWDIVDHLFKTQSRLARLAGQLPSTPPNAGPTAADVGGNNETNLSTSTFLGNPAQKSGIYLVDKTPMFDLLCIPPDDRILPGEPEIDIR